MKILQVNVNARSGSTGKIVTDIKNALQQRGHECLIAYGANETVDSSGYARICSELERKANAAISRVTGVIHGDFGFLSTPRLIKLIKTERPDIVHLHCANGYIVDLFRILKYLGTNNIKTVVTNHAEFFYTGTCGHSLDCNKWLSGCGKCPIYRKETHSRFDRTAYAWRRMKDAFDSFDAGNLIVTSVSPWLQSRAERSSILGRFRHAVVLNGLETAIFQPTTVMEDIASKFDSSKKLILFVSAHFDDTPGSFKGGDQVIQLAQQMPELQFCVAASYISLSGTLPPNMILWGRTKSQCELAQLYSLADCTVIASKRETFSMVTAESLCCGTPVVGFKAGGPESIAIADYSEFVEYGNLEALRNAINKVIHKKFDKTDLSLMAKDKYSKEAMTNNYIGVYNRLLTDS